MKHDTASPRTTLPRWFWHRRINWRGYHIALQVGRIAGIAVWPPGEWPKTPLLYWFIDCLRLKGERP